METQTSHHLSDVTVKPEVDHMTVTVKQKKKLGPIVPVWTEPNPE